MSIIQAFFMATGNAPSGLSYASPQTFTQNTAISPLSPTVTGTVTSYSVSPSLPSGLSISSSTGVISGTPTVTSSATTYTVTASNPYGSTTFPLSITVASAVSPPSGLSYPSPQTFTQNTAISPLSPTVTGTVTNYSVSPSLPTGLSINSSTGVISGTPTVTSSATGYVITASNSGGSTNFTLTITVTATLSPPSNLSYASPQTFTQNTAISPLSPSVTGTVTSYSVATSLPSGLSLNTSTGVISGTPTVSAASAGYQITASNSAGSTNFTIYITVQIAAPSNLSYPSPQTFTQNTAITALNPTVTGSVSSYSVSPSLPAGLNLNTSTGTISGTPTATSSATGYVITASNTTGSTNFTLTITVSLAAPSNLSYPSPQTYTQNSAIAVLNPTVTGTVTSYSVSPALPSGLSLNTSTGAISGTPTAISSATGYVITASNSSGSTNFTLTITVNSAFSPVTHTYTSGSGTETVPTGATSVTISAWGGGGSGGATDVLSTNIAGGGGGGGYASKTVSVTGGQTFSYSIGNGGTGVVPTFTAVNGNAGAATTVSGGSVSISAGGGSAGGVAGGAGGTASGGSTNTSGTNGGGVGSVSQASTGSTSYGGGSPNGGNNAIYSSSSGTGTGGNAPGGGSSGISGNYDVYSDAGAAGQVTFYYT